MSRIRRERLAVLAVVALVGLPGCGGNDNAGTVTGEEFLGHQLREISAENAPEVELELEADDHGGWNLHLATEGFAFTPDQLGEPAQAGQGHAHVYVDDVKFSRVYGEWFFLPASAVGPGDHTITVTLNADDHTAWAVDGEAIIATAPVTGMEEEHSNENGHAHNHGNGQEPAMEADAEFAFTIAEGQADPPLSQEAVEAGSTVRIVVESDQPTEVHLHGYDLTAEVSPEEPGVLEFVADQVGEFELEAHEPSLVLLQLQVQ